MELREVAEGGWIVQQEPPRERRGRKERGDLDEVIQQLSVYNMK